MELDYVRGMKAEEAAWVAGLFEGEGWFEVTYSKTVPGAARRVRLNLGSTDFDVLEKLQRIVGGTIIAKEQYRARFPNAKPIWVWRLASMDEVGAVIRLMMPWLSARRSDQAGKLIEALALVPPPGTSGQTHCKWGHPLTGDNLVERELNYRRCRTCRNDSARRRRERLRAALT